CERPVERGLVRGIGGCDADDRMRWHCGFADVIDGRTVALEPVDSRTEGFVQKRGCEDVFERKCYRDKTGRVRDGHIHCRRVALVADQPISGPCAAMRRSYGNDLVKLAFQEVLPRSECRLRRPGARDQATHAVRDDVDLRGRNALSTHL